MWKVEGKGLSKTSYFTEYQIGRRLCSLFGLPHDSRTPHRFVPNDCYAAILNIIVKYKITVDELVHGKIGPIYKRILYDIGKKRQSGKMYYRLHKKIFPSYLKTLNFKVYNDLLPVKNKFYSYCCIDDGGREIN